MTEEEERIYEGELGWANQICMKILARLGELFNATKLIPISWAHGSGVSYKTLGDAPIAFLEALASAGGKAKVKATLNPQSFDSEYIGRNVGKSIRQKQLNVLAQFEKMGFTESLSCTPYYLERPKKGSHMAWAESSAVVYANSVLGAWTNREGGPSALAAAIVGKTPNHGIHKAENRQPKALVKLEAKLKNEIEFGALGAYLGTILEDKIPIIQGLSNVSNDNLKQLCAAIATTGMVNMFHFGNVSKKLGAVEKVSIEARNIKHTVESLTTASKSKNPDLVFLGCPHCSLSEIKQIANQIGDRKIRSGVKCWICTSRYIREKAKGHVEKIEKSGCHVITDTCAVVTWTEQLGIKVIMTNSAKTAHYAPTLNKAETIFAPLKECLKAALKG
ncbi:MAG: aconitase X catalytic domain-containing protein [Candidatus Bathyarchaeota archaeon]|nr:aconitase X catalytic domain-containing protein [Candidatus Bathyarchaeota archaeon]